MFMTAVQPCSDLFNNAGHWAEDLLVHTEEYYGVGSVSEVDLTVPVP